NAEGALRADEKLLEIVARIIFSKAGEAVPDAPVRQHHLEAEDLLARVAIMQDLHAASIGRDIAADLAAPFRADAERKDKAVLLGDRLQVGKDAARIHGERAVQPVDLAHAVHPPGGNDDLIAAAEGDGAADKAGIAALRHDRRLRLGAEADERGDFFGRARQ